MRRISFAFSYSRTLKRLLLSTLRIVIMRGGTRSGKTYAILQMLAHWLMTGKLRNGEVVPAGVALVVRKYAATLKGTVLRDFETILSKAGVLGSVQYNKTDRTFSYRGRMVEFIGADDEQKLRGKKSVILYCNEANELNYRKEFFQLLVRCAGPVFLDFNPSDPYVWIKEKLEDERAFNRGDVETIVSTYKDNPYLNREQIDEIEALQHSDNELWQVYGLGQYGKVEGLIVPSITIIREWPDNMDLTGGGLDFGFANDPTAWYKCGIRPTRKRHQLFLDQYIYDTGLNEADLVARAKDAEIPKNMITMADPSHPGSIETLRRARFNVRGANKRPGSVKHGISLLRSHDIFVTARSTGFQKEQKIYKFKQHANGDWLNEPVKGNDHAMDAARYFLLRFAKIRAFK